MDISIFLAKALGLYFFILAIVMFINAQRVRTMMNEIASTPFMFVTGLMSLIIGILLVLSHNIWAADWKVIITIIGWLALIKGIVRLIFPEYVFSLIKKFVNNITIYYISNLIMLLLGIYLSYVGFIH